MLQYTCTEPEVGTGFAEVQRFGLLLCRVKLGNLKSKLFNKMLLNGIVNGCGGFRFHFDLMVSRVFRFDIGK